jgi:putative spermidine/putrescine transport system permease protein
VEKEIMGKNLGNSTVLPKPNFGLNGVMVLGLLFFTIPIISSILFSVQVGDGTYTIGAYQRMLSDPLMIASIWLSAQMTILTVLIILLLMVPTVTWIYIRAPKARRIVEFITILPLTIPPIVTGLGILNSMPNFMLNTPYLMALVYGVLTMPYTFRSLDNGLSSIDVRTLVDAGRGLGASWKQVLFNVIAPNIKSAIFGAVFLGVALVLGEFVIASVLLWETLPVWMANIGLQDAEGAVALSVMSLIFVWILLMILSLLDRKKKMKVQTRGVS